MSFFSKTKNFFNKKRDEEEEEEVPEEENEEVEDEEEEKEYSNASFEFEQVGVMEGSDIRASVVRSRNARRTRASRRRRAT